MKYVVLIMDGAAGLPLPEHGGKTSLELAETPNLDAMAPEGTLGLVRTVPEGMEASSACACMSLIGYDPVQYYQGRAAIEATSMGIPIVEGEVVFRCNLVAVRDGRMWDYSAGHIGSDDARMIIEALNEKLGSEEVSFYPGVSYRHICKLKEHEETLGATCTPPHDIPDRPIDDFLPKGPGNDFLKKLMLASQEVLREHPVNVARRAAGEVPATMLWLFWGSSQPREMPTFGQVYGLKAAMTSGVDLLKGLARMAEIDVLDISGMTDGLDNDYSAQAAGTLKALDNHDLVIVHVEAPDEAAHSGSVTEKVDAIQKIDRRMIGQLRAWKQDDLRLLVLPDHPTPIVTRTHSGAPVPFMLWGKGFTGNGAKRFTEVEAGKTGLLIDPGYNIMNWLVRRGLVG
ncbi:MAG TPA: cofactor-independent phosphoglycerate mutase [Dehalococcoidia bacterium]|nr:cofactor-independent phosphoglycerate mutase [Dehalococcoidia bacterium]